MPKAAIILLSLLVLILTFGAVLVTAPGGSAGGLSIPWWTIDVGGGTSAGGQFALSGTAGQADAMVMSGGTYVLQGGFWTQRTGGLSGGVGYQNYLPVVRAEN